MTTERSSKDRAPDVHRRAAVHAALAKPARLAIVDALMFGDASPSELQALVDLPSNLLAHHLNVLERARIVTRTRSQGDRRRSYLRLVPRAFDGLAPGSLGTAPRVLFVCTQNSARSPLAAALWRRRSSIPAASAGTAPAQWMHPGAVAAARRHGLPLRRTRPRQVDDVVRASDLVVTVCDSAHERLGAAARLHWSIPDPVRVGSDAAFDRAFDELSRRAVDLAPRLDAA